MNFQKHRIYRKVRPFVRFTIVVGCIICIIIIFKNPKETSKHIPRNSNNKVDNSDTFVYQQDNNQLVVPFYLSQDETEKLSQLHAPALEKKKLPQKPQYNSATDCHPNLTDINNLTRHFDRNWLVDSPLEKCHEKNCINWYFLKYIFNISPRDFVNKEFFIQTTNQKNIDIWKSKRAKAAITILCRNSDLEGMKDTLNSFEPLFNSKFKYPYLFMNDIEFTTEFKDGIIKHIKHLRDDDGGVVDVVFMKLPSEAWGYPLHINQTRVHEVMNDVKDGLESYRFMIRFFSGPFFNLGELKDLDYYWRIEPNVDYYCKIDYDPFLFMQSKNIKYGFNIVIPELMDTIPSLFSTTEQFLKINNLKPRSDLMRMMLYDQVPVAVSWEGNPYQKGTCGFNFNVLINILEMGRSEMGFVITKVVVQSMAGVNPYNGNHFWSNFEIGSLNFFRGNLYSKYFEHLDKAGGFFYERWGDAPVHSLAVSMFLEPKDVHYFGDIGYRHDNLLHCPNPPVGCGLECRCEKIIERMPKWTENHIYDWTRWGSDPLKDFRNV